MTAKFVFRPFKKPSIIDGLPIMSIAEKSCAIQVFSDAEAGQDEIISHRVAG
jgi:hypothetical protein